MVRILNKRDSHFSRSAQQVYLTFGFVQQDTIAWIAHRKKHGQRASGARDAREIAWQIILNGVRCRSGCRSVFILRFIRIGRGGQYPQPI